ncbi:MAG: histidine phosphatase family protein, partial [Pseudomonadota bacterium]
MKTVILLRHAKSSWSDPELEDHERPLNKRGKAAAPLMGDWLERSGYRPDLVLCSPAKRTRQTLRRIAAAMPD